MVWLMLWDGMTTCFCNIDNSRYTDPQKLIAAANGNSTACADDDASGGPFEVGRAWFERSWGPWARIVLNRVEEVLRVSLPEWSKGLRSGRNVFERVGSNPTADIPTASAHAGARHSFCCTQLGHLFLSVSSGDPL